MFLTESRRSRRAIGAATAPSRGGTQPETGLSTGAQYSAGGLGQELAAITTLGKVKGCWKQRVGHSEDKGLHRGSRPRGAPTDMRYWFQSQNAPGSVIAHRGSHESEALY